MTPLKFLKALAFKLDRPTNITLGIWLAIAIFGGVQAIITNRYNNYLIFENTVRNLIAQQSFYVAYPKFHEDTSHYGPVFALFFMPFAALKNEIGLVLWDLFTTIMLYCAIYTLPIKKKWIIYLVAIPCLIASVLSEQSNPLIAAFIILTFTKLNTKKGLWSTMFIALGTFIKLYGIVGLAFFFFVKDKKRFVSYLIMWGIVFFALPMLFSSPTFILNSYREWMVSLSEKNVSNILSNTIDISIMGFMRQLFGNRHLSNLLFLLVGGLVFLIPYLNTKNFSNSKFQLLILASVLMFTVLFSTGSEDCTYIIAIPGVGIWYLLTKNNILKRILLGVVFVFSSNFPQILFHDTAAQHPILLTMLSVPFFVVWVFTIYDAYRAKDDVDLKSSKVNELR